VFLLQTVTTALGDYKTTGRSLWDTTASHSGSSHQQKKKLLILLAKKIISQTKQRMGSAAES